MKKALFEQLTASLQEAAQIKNKKLAPGRPLRINPDNAVAHARRKLGMSQAKFAALIGVSIDTLQNWEQGRRKPSGSAQARLNIITAPGGRAEPARRRRAT